MFEKSEEKGKMLTHGSDNSFAEIVFDELRPLRHRETEFWVQDTLRGEVLVFDGLERVYARCEQKVRNDPRQRKVLVRNVSSDLRFIWILGTFYYVFKNILLQVEELAILQNQDQFNKKFELDKKFEFSVKLRPFSHTFSTHPL